MDYPPYDLERLERVARQRLVADRRAPTAINIAMMVERLRDELAYLAGYNEHVDYAIPIPGGCVELAK